GGEKPERGVKQKAEKDREQETSRHREHPGRESRRTHNEHLGDNSSIEGRSQQRVDQDTRAVGAESQQKDTVVGDRKRKHDRGPSGPSMDDLIEASLGRKA